MVAYHDLGRGVFRGGVVDPEIDPNFGEIIDLTEVKRMNLSGDEMRVIAKKTAFLSSSRSAIVVPDNDSVLGLVRMYEILRELQGETGIRIFHTLDEALSWVAPKTTRT
jgi:hypothetical protein